MSKFLIVTLLGLGLFFGIGAYAACSSNSAPSTATDCADYCSYLSVDTANCSAPSDSVCYCNPLQGQGLEAITTPIINFIFKLSIVVVPVLITWAAFKIVTAAGDSKKIEDAKKIILWTLIGFALVLLSRGASDLLSAIIGS